tara:strand:- start:1108 stop:1554 length:447 start_codon:yes stop_codon:yes gene_type:complete
MVVEASKFAKTHGYVVHNERTNSRRWFPEILKMLQGKPYDSFIVMTEESAARNSRIQGTQSDMLAEAMVLLDRYINIYKLDIQMKMQVHDRQLLSCLNFVNCGKLLKTYKLQLECELLMNVLKIICILVHEQIMYYNGQSAALQFKIK